MSIYDQADILIVDDDPLNTDLLQAWLQTAGYSHIRIAEHGVEALELIAQQIPDLVLLDVMMPKMNGFQVIERIREDYKDHFIPIILLSALQAPKQRAQGIELGANDFLTKPYDSVELIARIHSILERKQIVDALDSERKRLGVLYDISRVLTAHLDTQEIIDTIVSLTTQLTGAAKAELIVLDDHGGFKEKLLAHAGQTLTSRDQIHPLVMSEGLVGWIVQNGLPVILNDVETDSRWKKIPDEDTSGSAIGVPLRHAERILGALLLTSPQKAAFNDEHVVLVQAIGSQAMIALENARLYEEAAQERARMEALLNQVSGPVIVTDASAVITRINPAARTLFNLSDRTLLKPMSEVFELALVDLLTRAQERRGAVSGEYSPKSQPKEERKSYNVSISPIGDEGFILIWQDISGLKESERVKLDVERAQTQLVLDTFSRYMSTKLIDRVMGDRDILNRRERREAVVLFADLRGFTRLTVEHEPDKVITLLNDVFNEMISIVNAHEGLVFDITGDELMVAFNVPYEQQDVNRLALTTGINMQKKFAELRGKWAAQGLEVGMGIGINRGSVVLGHVGGRDRMTYAMVGEAVNIAHRLVEIAKDSEIIVTPEILTDGIPDIIPLSVEEMPPTSVKGKDKPQPMTIISPRTVKRPAD